MDRNVIFLSPVPDFKGGAERSLMDLMGNPNIRPRLVVPAEGPLSKRATELGIPYDVLEFGRISDIRRPFRLGDGIKVIRDLLAAATKLKKLAQKYEARVVHSNGLKAHAINVTSRILGGAPSIIHIRDIANTGIERLTWRCLQLASTRTVLVSRACWPHPTLPGNTHVVYNGFRIGNPNLPDAPQNGEDIVIGFAGRIHPAKGLHVLLAALALARQHVGNLRLIVRGEFASETPDYKSEIETQVGDLGLIDAVTFDGFVSEPDAVYRGVNVVCVPSVLPDPLPRSVMEAMGRSLVVIAAPCGGIPEMIEHGQTGFLAGTPEEIAKHLVELAKTPTLRREIGEKAATACRVKFDIGVLHARITEVYDSAAARL